MATRKRDLIQDSANGYVFNDKIGATSILFNGDTSTANALDDYEEGTFTPVIVGSTTSGSGTYTSNEGSYVKVGRQVTIELRVIWTAHTGAGQLQITGLPYSIGGGVDLVTSPYINNMTLTGKSVFINSGANLGMYQENNGVSSSVSIQSSGTILIMVTYITD